MTGMNAVISGNLQRLLKQNGTRNNELAKALVVSKQVMSNIMAGTRMVTAFELQQMASFLHVPMETLMVSHDEHKEANTIHTFMGQVKTSLLLLTAKLSSKGFLPMLQMFLQS